MNNLVDSETFKTAIESLAFGDTTSRTRVSIRGKDRISMLQGFCTADLKKLEVGQGTEAFILNPKGKIVGFVRYFLFAEELILESEPDQAETLIGHLDRYVIREDVQFENATDKTHQLTVVGPSAKTWLQDNGWLSGGFYERLGQRQSDSILLCEQLEKEGEDVFVLETQRPCKQAFAIHGSEQTIATLNMALEADGILKWDPPTEEALRIESGIPAYGLDITEDNLPQEIARDERTISFKKGCYLGQETVARIDALGHVNKLLVSMRFEPDQDVVIGEEILRDGASVGRVTSKSFSPIQNLPIALGFVKRGSHEIGTELACDKGAVTITG